MTLCFLLVLLFGATTVSVERSDGSKVDGTLESFDLKNLVVNGQAIPASDLVEIEFPLNELTGTAGPRVRLRGGSLLPVKRVRFDGKTLIIERRRQDDLKLPAKQLKSIRFRPPLAITDPSWLGYLNESVASDRLVIRRDGNNLDVAEGVIESVTEDLVGFSIDGQSVTAPRERLEGLILASSDADDSPAPIEVRDIYGGVWRVDQVSRNDDVWKLQLGDVEHALRETLLRKIVFGGTRTALTSLKPVSQKNKTPFNIDLGNQNDPPQLLDQAGLQLSGESAAEFRVPDNTSQVSGRALRPDEVVAAGKTVVRVVIDGQTAWEEALVNREAKGFQLPLNKARRIRFEVDDGGDGSLGDLVRFERVFFQ